MASLVEFSMSPMDKGASVGAFVARSLDIVDRSGLDYRLHAMGTILEGELPDCLRVIEQCYQRMRQDCDRISCTIKIDFRREATGRLHSKIARIESELGRPLRS